ncbi:MAG: tyrosine-type recombinase/integrase [Candidatus Pacearchaeota archaeon]
MSYVPVNWEESLHKECTRRKLSPRTHKTYHYCISRFFGWIGKDIGKISKKDVREFLNKMADKGLSGNSLNTYHMALRFLFEEVLDKRIWIDIKYSKTPEKLPLVLSKEEVKKLFEAISNEKHRLMIELMYSAGLRVSELLNLRICDLEIEKRYGFVRAGKGNKDRLFILPEKLTGRIKELIAQEKLTNDDYLFISNRNKKYSIRSIQQILKKASRKARIGKKIHPHTLRHSFATHLIENGYSVSDVQALLGHKSPETTMIYVHMASPSMITIKSPFDNL